jgi:hypothetical protein
VSEPTFGDLIVRINVVGHASRRWNGAKNAAEAERLNQLLSERRAENVCRAVREILTGELPGMAIEVPSKGVGSRERFPTTSENNAAVDRSVLVTVELTTTHRTYQFQPRGPRRVYIQSNVWSVRVVNLARMAGLGAVRLFVRVVVRNRYTGKEAVGRREIESGRP